MASCGELNPIAVDKLHCISLGCAAELGCCAVLCIPVCHTISVVIRLQKKRCLACQKLAKGLEGLVGKIAEGPWRGLCNAIAFQKSSRPQPSAPCGMNAPDWTGLLLYHVRQKLGRGGGDKPSCDHFHQDAANTQTLQCSLGAYGDLSRGC